MDREAVKDKTIEIPDDGGSIHVAVVQRGPAHLTASFLMSPNSSRTRSRRSISTGLFTVPVLSPLFHPL